MPDSESVTQVLPEKKQLPLRALYLDQGLASLASRLQKPLVLSTYLTDRNEVIAKANQDSHFQVPLEIRNESDWRLSQELMAQADVLISGGDYLKQASTSGRHPQDILHQFERGGEFQDLGEWRLHAGYEKRSPDLAVATRHLDFKIPEEVLRSGRRIAIFTTSSMANSAEAKALANSGTVVLGTGHTGVDGKVMIDYLSHEMGARVIVMVTGPSVLQLLLQAKRLDLLYITQVQREIPFDDPMSVKTLLPDGKTIQDIKEFRLTQKYVQDDVLTANGSRVSQFFLRYERI